MPFFYNIHYSSLISLFVLFLLYLYYSYSFFKDISKSIISSFSFFSNPYILLLTFFMSLPVFQKENDYLYANYYTPLLYVLTYIFFRRIYRKKWATGFIDFWISEFEFHLSKKKYIPSFILWLILLQKFKMDYFAIEQFPIIFLIVIFYIFVYIISLCIKYFKKK